MLLPIMVLVLFVVMTLLKYVYKACIRKVW